MNQLTMCKKYLGDCGYLNLPDEVMFANSINVGRALKDFVDEYWYGSDRPTRLVVSSPKLFETIIKSPDFNENSGEIKGFLLLVHEPDGGNRIYD